MLKIEKKSARSRHSYFSTFYSSGKIIIGYSAHNFLRLLHSKQSSRGIIFGDFNARYYQDLIIVKFRCKHILKIDRSKAKKWTKMALI